MNAVRVVIPVVVAGLVVAYVSNPTVPPASSYHGKTIEDYVQCKVKGIEWFNTKQQWLTWTSWPCGDLEKDYRGGKIRYQPAMLFRWLSRKLRVDITVTNHIPSYTRL